MFQKHVNLTGKHFINAKIIHFSCEWNFIKTKNTLKGNRGSTFTQNNNFSVNFAKKLFSLIFARQSECNIKKLIQFLR